MVLDVDKFLVTPAKGIVLRIMNYVLGENCRAREESPLLIVVIDIKLFNLYNRG